jgi:DNA-binding NtrC family response regulator
MHNILIVDDESGIRDSLKGVLEDEATKPAKPRVARPACVISKSMTWT